LKIPNFLHNFVIVTLPVATDKTAAFIEENLVANLTDYQKQINEALKELCLANPNLISNRGLLIEQAQEKSL